MRFEDIVISDEMLNISNNCSLDREIRRSILQMSKAGFSFNLIGAKLNLPRHLIRAVLTPNYRGNKKSPNKANKKINQEKSEEFKEKYTYREQALMTEGNKPYDPSVTAQQCIENLRSLQKKYPYRWLTRTMYRAEGLYPESTWVPKFGNFQEFRRAAGCEPTRYQAAIEKAIAKHSSLDHYSQFHVEKVMPYVGLYNRRDVKREKIIVVISDIHGMAADPFALSVFFDTIKRIQPDVICVNGDLDDGYVWSKYNVDPRLADLIGEVAWCRNFFKNCREACPESEIDFNLGNHEWRVFRHMADASPYMKELLSGVFGLSVGDIYAVKDYEVNINCKWDFRAFKEKDVEKEIAKNFIIYDKMFAVAHIYDKALAVMSGTSAHTHKPRLHTSRNPLSNRTSWVTTGCMCKMDPEYVTDMDTAQHGFAIFHLLVNKGIVVPELITIPGDVAVVGGKYYYRED